MIRSVACSYPAVLQLQLVSGAKALALHSANYYRVAFSALNYSPPGELHPCTDLEGMQARVEYVDAGGQEEIVAVELRK